MNGSVYRKGSLRGKTGETRQFGAFLALLCAVLTLTAFVPVPSLAEGEIGLITVPEIIRPGKTERYVYTLPAAGRCSCMLYDGGGQPVGTVFADQPAVKGENSLAWDGCTENGVPTPGEYRLYFLCGEASATFTVTVGAEAPRIGRIELEEIAADGTVTALADCSCAGVLTVSADMPQGRVTVWSGSTEAGTVRIEWNGIAEGVRLPEGDHVLQFALTDESGFTGTKQNRSFTYPSFPEPEVPSDEADGGSPEAEAPEQAEEEPVPGEGAPSAKNRTVIPSGVSSPDDPLCYWTLPLGELDEERIWEVMLQPMTVIDGDQTSVYRLRATPDNSTAKSNVVGEITYASQGVHVLETLDNGWSYVEAYNSSYGPKCKSRPGYGVTNELIRGYVKTSLLKTVTPLTNIGLLIDKKNQTMYIFEDGHITGTLLVSTGLNNKTQSWNETPSGEYVMISKAGGFPAGNLWCAYGMRINGGCMIHEVPYIGNNDTPAARRDYSSTVKLLGQKASHGCIRVQRAANEAGQNIKWLWDHMKVGTKVLIWEDTGRFTEYPEEAFPLYYNPTGGKYYHDDQNCKGVKTRWLPLTAFTWGELDTGEFAQLTLCPTCGKTLRRAEIDELNRENGF